MIQWHIPQKRRKAWRPRKIGLALGGGGARGFAHFLVIDALERLGITPALIAGTSMGAIAGALYASGNHGKILSNDLNKSLLHGSAEEKGVRKVKDKLVRTSEVLKLLAPHKSDLSLWSYFSITKILEQIFSKIEARSFEDLAIPFKAVTVDFWAGEEYVIDSGPLIPAIRASMAVPIVFAPVKIDNRVLVDGGLMNSVPWNKLDDCDFTIAVDVKRKRQTNMEDKKSPGKIPNVIDSITRTIDIMGDSRIRADLKNAPPTLYVWLEIEDVGLLEFNKIDSVVDQVRPQVKELERELQAFFLS